MEAPVIQRYKEKSVIIHRDENGFGLRVGGEIPVFVDCVHENGAAWKAGVRKGDRIIKVNGTLVRLYNHQEVVQMIQNCTPFVNLTLHSPETVVPDSYPADALPSIPGQPHTKDPASHGGIGGLHLSHSSSNISMNTSNSSINNNNTSLNPSNIQAYPMNHHDHPQSKLNPHHPYSSHNHRQHHPHGHQRRHHSNPHSMSNSWLHEIGNDLFQDNHHLHQRSSVPMSNNHQLQMQPELIPTTSNHGVSKLIVSGPNPWASSAASSSTNNGGKDHRLSKQQQQLHANNVRDNPYYYYKTAPEKASDAASCNSSSTAPLLSTHLGQDQQQQGTSAKATASLSMVRSRSSSKMSIRSTTGKYKPRNFRSRIVEDFRALTITNNAQAAPSSLSTSPSSSDLSDCDDLETVRLDCLALNNNSTLSNSPSCGGALGAADSTNLNASNAPTVIVRSKITTRRLEIIKELVETEKTHIEKLKQLNDLLYKPIKAENLIPPDQLKMVFSCHKNLYKIHRQIYKKLVAAQMNISEVHQEPLVGRALIEIFKGELGERLEKAASSFCACQSTNTDLLNRITRKDTKSGEFLAQVANQQMLGRLGIKDLLASCFQRLTKYPLLLENLLKATPNTGSSGMMHSKSLSEGSIAVCPSVQSSANNSSATITTNEETGDEPRPEAQPSEHLGGVASPAPNVSSATVSRSNSGASESTEGSENETNDETSAKNSSAITSPIITTIKASTSTICANNNNNNNNNNSFLSNSSSIDEYAYERLCIDEALQFSRQILIHVNEAVNKAIAQNKLRDIWRKTVFNTQPPDKSDKLEDKKTVPIPVIDIESELLLHEGSLTLRFQRRSYEVYVVLLTHYLVILTREGQDKYKLKYFTSDAKSPQHFYSPVFNIDEHLATRDTATDENGFYLIYKRKDDSRIYEFASQSPADRAKWKEKIHLAQLYNSSAVPEDDNTLTRYTELISLANDPVDEQVGSDERS